MKIAVVLISCLAITGAVLAGAPPEATAVAGCHGKAVVAAPAAACHGQETLLAPAVAAEGACHGGRVTASERRLARQSARQNARATKSAFISAAREGRVQAVPVAQPNLEIVPVAADDCGCD